MMQEGNPSIVWEASGAEEDNYAEYVYNRFKQEDAKSMALHAALGVCGEAGELADAIKKQYIYGKDPNYANVKEELGDLYFYMTAVMNLYGFTIQEVVQANMDKLNKRYPEKVFKPEHAIVRLDKEAGEV
ncbi:MAG: nucleoside triphosphate pyrophosphohydrolase family protein [Waterburya sp.]